jgi:hypothetical protein
MGVSVKHRFGFTSPGSVDEHLRALLDPVAVTVGHIHPHTADIIAKDLVCPGHAAVMIAVTRHLMEPDVGKLLCHHLTILIKIAQMHHMIGLYMADAVTHKAQRAVGIG